MQKEVLDTWQMQDRSTGCQLFHLDLVSSLITMHVHQVFKFILEETFRELFRLYFAMCYIQNILVRLDNSHFY